MIPIPIIMPSGGGGPMNWRDGVQIIGGALLFIYIVAPTMWGAMDGYMGDKPDRCEFTTRLHYAVPHFSATCYVFSWLSEEP